MAVSKPKVTRQPKGNGKKKRVPSAPKPSIVTVEQIAPVTDITNPVPVVEPVIDPVAVADPVQMVTLEPTVSRSGGSPVWGVIGGSVAGIVAYKGFKTVFINKGLTEDKAVTYAVLSGIVCAVIVFSVIYGMTKKTA
jgi:hypothetical protein